MSSIEQLHNRIDLSNIPFTDRASRMMLFRRENTLFIRMAERWDNWKGKKSHYRLHPPIVDQFVLLDSEAQPLDFQVDSYPHVVNLMTTMGTFSWTFVDTETLLVGVPAGQHHFRFLVLADSVLVERRGGTLRGIRNIAYTTNARVVSNTITLVSDESYQVDVVIEVTAATGNGFLLNITPRLGFNHSVPEVDKEIAAARARWEAWFDVVPPVDATYRPQYDYAWWVMRMGLLSQRYYFTREALSPSKIHYIGVWQWDQFFHALAFRHVDIRLAEDQFRIVFDHQRADGMLPDAIHDEGLVTHLTTPVDADVTKPPLAAWGVLKLFDVSGHHDFLEEVYEPLTRWHEWWIKNSGDGSGLCEYRHPFSSGLDDSPIWDSGMPVTSPDLNTYLCIQLESLARIADLIGYPQDAARYRDDATAITQLMVDKMWSEREGLFLALHKGEFIPVATPFSLLPLWTNKLPEAIKNRLLNQLTDPTMFWTDYPLATVSVTDPTFDAMQMWRGPTWVNINYLFVEALTRIGQDALAGKLRRKTLDIMSRHNDIYEYYNPLTGERPPKAAPLFGWSSAVFIDLALQESGL